MIGTTRNTKKPEFTGPAVKVLGFRPGSKKAIAASMYIGRKRGATNLEVIERIGKPQRNLLKEALDKGHRVEKTQVTYKGKKLISYRIKLV